MILDRYIRIKGVAVMLGIDRSTTYRLITENKFTKQIKLTEISF
jgi:predicted DNA-binding transcriptional regulator AlpA